MWPFFFLNAGCFSRYLQVESCCSCQDLETCHLIIFLLLMLVYDQSCQVMLLLFFIQVIELIMYVQSHFMAGQCDVNWILIFMVIPVMRWFDFFCRWATYKSTRCEGRGGRTQSAMWAATACRDRDGPTAFRAGMSCRGTWKFEA
jgi:hypothetical protein